MKRIKKYTFYARSSLITIILLILIVCSGCGHRIYESPTHYNGFTKVDLCDLKKYKNQTVYTQGAYSGVDEYWSFYSLAKKCKHLNVDLDVPPDINLKPSHEKLLKWVHENYYKAYLIIDAIGKFETGNEMGYGHLGTKNARFIVKEIINIRLIEAKQ